MREAVELDRLTPREREVLALMAGGLSNDAICARLWVSGKTVETHVRSIYLKLGIPADDRLRDRRVAAAIVWWSAREAQAPTLRAAA